MHEAVNLGPILALGPSANRDQFTLCPSVSEKGVARVQLIRGDHQGEMAGVDTRAIRRADPEWIG